MKRPLEERFWEKVEKTESCWLWTASTTTAGYGNIKVSGVDNLTAYAHRLSYERIVGPIPHGLSLDHLCRNTRCVNPDHLEPVTHAENVRRGRAGWNTRSRTHCPQGHEYSKENTLVRRTSGGGFGRWCITCKKLRDRERAARKRREKS